MLSWGGREAALDQAEIEEALKVLMVLLLVVWVAELVRAAPVIAEIAQIRALTIGVTKHLVLKKNGKSSRGT